MPELPEVETLRRQLEKVLPGSKIHRIEVLDTSRIGALENVCDCRVVAVKREGKFLKIQLSGGKEIVVHLRMTGHLLWEEKGRTSQEGIVSEMNAGGIYGGSKHARMLINFAHGSVCLVDPRRFATVEIRDAKGPVGKIPDAYRDSLTGRKLMAAAANRKIPVKNFLLDQKAVAGLGNIYVCEILFRAGVDPWKKACELNEKEWGSIVREFKPVLGKAIACRGSSVSDWRDLLGKKGTYQDHLQVYGREAEPCLRCGNLVDRKPIGGRSTFYCPKCQGVANHPR